MPRTFRSRYTEYQSLGNGLLFVPIAVIIVRTVIWRWDEGRRAECSDPLGPKLRRRVPFRPSWDAPNPEIRMIPVLQGLGARLILLLSGCVTDEQTRAVASAEVRALQACMHPHFLLG